MADTVHSSGRAPNPALMERSEELAYELRGQEGAIWTGGRLLMGIATFAFASLAFAYFYLRSANNEGLWRPHSVTAPTSYGTGIFAVSVACTLLNVYGTLRMRKGIVVDWEVSGWVAVTGLLIAVSLQILQLRVLPFYPGSSGYASCFLGWAVMNCGLLLVSAYWLETVLAVARSGCVGPLVRTAVRDGHGSPRRGCSEPISRLAPLSSSLSHYLRCSSGCCSMSFERVPGASQPSMEVR